MEDLIQKAVQSARKLGHVMTRGERLGTNTYRLTCGKCKEQIHIDETAIPSKRLLGAAYVEACTKPTPIKEKPAQADSVRKKATPDNGKANTNPPIQKPAPALVSNGAKAAKPKNKVS